MINKFFGFINARHRLHQKKVLNLPKPWTDNPIFQEYKFCNVYRELDTVTIWIKENIRDRWPDHPNLWFALAVARRINLPITLSRLDNLLVDWDPYKAYAHLEHRSYMRLPVYNGAYSLTTSSRKMSKNQYTVYECLDKLWEKKQQISDTLKCQPATLENTFDLLSVGNPGISDFLAYEIVTDMRHTKYLKNATDIMTWANAGPGAIRGLNRIHGNPLDSKINPCQANKDMQYLLSLSDFHIPLTFQMLEMRDIEHCLCEFDKYMRIKSGGSFRCRKYNGKGKDNKMFVIDAVNVNDALLQGVKLIADHGEKVESRGGMTVEVPFPVSTVYRNPLQKVLMSRVRDANPFFHLMEAMWILAGRKDVKFLTEFNKRMVDYSDDGEVFNAPYGHRLRDAPHTNEGFRMDQLQVIIDILRVDPNSRQAVAQIWDPRDLDKTTKDKACNMSLVFRVRKGELHLTVYNRSNDMIWGAYGANVVQFSTVLEYVAAHLNIPVGTYTQVSNSYHIYTDGPGGKVWDKVSEAYDNTELFDFSRTVDRVVVMKHDQMGAFNYDLNQFFNAYDQFGLEELGEFRNWQSDYFNFLVMPVLCIYLIHKQHGPEEALKYTHTIVADDWKFACEDWLNNRIR